MRCGPRTGRHMRFNHLRRRDFITLLGGAAATWPVAARGQRPAMPVIGFLGANTASLQREWTDAFVQRLRELGWIEGRNLAIEHRGGAMLHFSLRFKGRMETGRI